jgi:hypothetical protein
MDGVDGDANGPADVDDLEVARADELVHRAPGNPECPTGLFDGQKEYETTFLPIVGRRGGTAVGDLRWDRRGVGWLDPGPHHGRIVESPELRRVPTSVAA